MIAFDFNGEKLQPTSTEEVSGLLGRVDKSSMFELWATVSNGPSLCMRRNGGDAWLMYLRQEGDSGFSSRSFGERSGTANFWLSNGQSDECPLSWCIDVDQCYIAMVYFFENEGKRPEWIKWHED
jgi:hypothetical protein